MSARVLSLHRNSTSPSRQEMNDTRHNKWSSSTLTSLAFPAAKSLLAKTIPSSPNFPVLTLSSQHLHFAEHVSSGDPSDLIKILTALELHGLAWSCSSPHCPSTQAAELLGWHPALMVCHLRFTNSVC